MSPGWADKAYAGGVLFIADRQARLPGDLPHLALEQPAHREHRLRQGVLVDHIEEVGLVLVLVGGPEQAILAARLVNAREVARHQLFRAQLLGEIQEDVELDLPIAQHVRVGRAALFVFLQEVAEHPVHVLFGEVHRVIGDVQLFAHGAGVGPVALAGAHAALVLLLPVLHEHADHLVTGPLHHQRRHGAVHAAGHADHHAHTIASIRLHCNTIPNLKCNHLSAPFPPGLRAEFLTDAPCMPANSLLALTKNPLDIYVTF